MAWPQGGGVGTGKLWNSGMGWSVGPWVEPGQSPPSLRSLSPHPGHPAGADGVCSSCPEPQMYL